MKYLKNFSMIALVAIATSASPAFAQNTTISVVGEHGLGAVYDSSEIKMAPLPGGVPNLTYAENPTFFDGKQLCASGRDANWALKKDGSIVNSPRQPNRRVICTAIVNGKATLTTPFGREQDLFISDGTRLIAWAADNTLTPYHNN